MATAPDFARIETSWKEAGSPWCMHEHLQRVGGEFRGSAPYGCMTCGEVFTPGSTRESRGVIR